MSILEKAMNFKITIMKNREDYLDGALDILTILIAELKTEAINKRVTALSETEEIVVAKRIEKRLHQELDSLKVAHRNTERVETQLALITSYLPKVKSDEETKAYIESLKESGLSFKETMQKIAQDKGSFNMQVVSKLAKEIYN